MPAWTKKSQRQYEHIKQSSKDRGASEKRAQEIAARTVNKTRRQKGQTPANTTQGSGNRNTSLEERSKDEHYNIAQETDIEGRSKMKKSELIRAIRSPRR